MKTPAWIAACTLCCASLPVLAQDVADFELGVRGAIFVSDGEPANDITGVGALFRHHLDNGWAWGVAIDVGEFDFERPARLLGIDQDDGLEAIDAKADVTDFSAFLERHFALNDRWSWFWQAGGGVGSIDVPRAAGPTADGGTFDIRIDADTEPFLLGALGVRRELGRLSIEGAFTAQYRFSDYQLVDTVSGQTGTVDGHLPYGIYIALLYRF